MAADFHFVSGRRPHVLLDRFDCVLESRYASPKLGLPEMADEMGMSTRQLQRKLKGLTGHTPSAYIRSYRLYQSLDHLKCGEKVGETAKKVGFSSQAYFACCFKAEFGTTPTRFRQDID
jgi:AraC-like DNA-binding protein